jgi:hypothetical protein
MIHCLGRTSLGLSRAAEEHRCHPTCDVITSDTVRDMSTNWINQTVDTLNIACKCEPFGYRLMRHVYTFTRNGSVT